MGCRGQQQRRRSSYTSFLLAVKWTAAWSVNPQQSMMSSTHHLGGCPLDLSPSTMPIPSPSLSVYHHPFYKCIQTAATSSWQYWIPSCVSATFLLCWCWTAYLSSRFSGFACSISFQWREVSFGQPHWGSISLQRKAAMKRHVVISK